MPVTGPWPVYMDGYTGGIDVYVDGVKIQQPVRGIDFIGASGAFDANTGIATITVDAGAQGATGPAGPTGVTGATGATGPGA